LSKLSLEIAIILALTNLCWI